MKDRYKIKKNVEENMSSMPSLIFKPSFDFIFDLIDNHDAKISFPRYGIENKNALLTKDESGGFTIEVDIILSDKSERYKAEINVGGRTFLVSDLFILKRGVKSKRNENNELFLNKASTTGHINELTLDKNYETETYNRFIIETNNFKLESYIKTTGFRDESYIYSYGKLFLQIDDHDLILYEKKYRDKYYFILDSVNLIYSEKFHKICHSVMIGLGFLSGDFIQKEAFYFKSIDSDFSSIFDFSYLELRPSIITHGSCNPIYSNPYGYTKDEKIINKVGNKIDVFDSKIFSTLCSKINQEEDYETLMLLLLEANSSSLILKPVGYSVALEKITNIVVEENKGLKPIPNKKISQNFKYALTKTLQLFTNKIKVVGNEDSLIILQKNIDKINNPTNTDKLIKPFQIFNIPLYSSDMEAINYRNDFLHGRNIKPDESSCQFVKIDEISLRLNTLINKLILKHLGYSGYIINHLKHNENSFDFVVENELFEKI